MTKEVLIRVSASSFVNTHSQQQFLLSVPEITTFVLSADLDILRSAADCNNLLDGRRISVSVIVHHVPLLSFSSLPSSTWIYSAYLPVNTDPVTLDGWTCWTSHWFSDDHVVILNSV